MKAFKTFIKPFEAPQRGVKIKIYVNFFSLRPGLGREGLQPVLQQSKGPSPPFFAHLSELINFYFP